MSQYIGKTISLVSVTENRYVGLLEEIDSEKGTVTLQNVRCFGTEGRKNWGAEEIYPNPTIYKSVKFNGNEVKDLSILDVKLEDVQPVLPPQGVIQPAVGIPQGQVPAAVAGYGVYAPEPAASVQEEVATRRQEQQTRAAPDQRRQPAQGRKVEIPQEDFDFQSNNAKFVRDDSENAGAGPSQNEPAANEESHPEQFYNKKSSFFDSISTSTDTAGNMRWQEEKAMNIDTFGQASARPRFGRGGRGRGGRGGRGRGNRGRGNRGGFQSRNSHLDDSQNGQFARTQQIEF
ncbi:hypothetical protein HG536_0C02330 [Torulaspora globosa]|uniref:DFDF domain-containing protein n=1 Tax=Torulaspora globosa TaxID=48254 RepID=A0A7G3ZEX8_9SACH|nr:uncharacterized protein HG536_0C02330 [Torulaspora globosa]QLL32064.1 hypothetical protein HG536_0C02330 [Torulaspora globosa]